MTYMYIETISLEFVIYTVFWFNFCISSQLFFQFKENIRLSFKSLTGTLVNSKGPLFRRLQGKHKEKLGSEILQLYELSSVVLLLRFEAHLSGKA